MADDDMTTEPASPHDQMDGNERWNHDAEMQQSQTPKAQNVSAFKALGWLDRFLAVWILLAIIVGILIGNFVPSAGPALQKGQFVGVSIPIGEYAIARGLLSAH